MHRVEPVMIDHDPARCDWRLQPPLHLLEPVTVIDGGQDAPIRSQEGLVLELEILGERHEDVPDLADLAVVVPDVLLER